MKKVTRCPWGSFEVLSEAPGHKVKRITVEPGGSLSLQLHHQRAEHWFVVAGKGLVTVGSKRKSLRVGSAIDIPKKAKHRIRNSSTENLVFIEVQTGEYCGDDDIERFEDIYGRV
jgi:mannose-6-phosphate isomerase-like protein (cupin superfamily)